MNELIERNYLNYRGSIWPNFAGQLAGKIWPNRAALRMP